MELNHAARNVTFTFVGLRFFVSKLRNYDRHDINCFYNDSSGNENEQQMRDEQNNVMKFLWLVVPFII